MSKLGQLLVARGWITVQQLTRALKNQNVVGGRLGTCLLEMEVLGEELLARSLAEQLGVPAGDIEDLRAIPDEVLSLIPEKLARRCRAIPFRVAGGRLDVVMQDPRNLVCQDEIAFACGRRVKVHVLHELRIQEALQRYYREECPSRYSLLIDRLNRARYLWGDAGRQERGKAAAYAGDNTEVLSRLPADDLLGGPPRFEPPPLPEPSTPAKLRRSWRTAPNAVAASPASPASLAGSAQPPAPPVLPKRPEPPGHPELPQLPHLPPTSATSRAPEATRSARPTAPPRPAVESLPPLAELDLRATPRRQRALDATGKPIMPGAPAPAVAAGGSLAPASETTPARITAEAAPPAPQAPATAPAAAAADLDITLAFRPPSASAAVPPPHPGPVSGRFGGFEPAARATPLAAHPIVTLSDAERAELEARPPAGPPGAVTSPAETNGPASPLAGASPTPPLQPAQASPSAQPSQSFQPSLSAQPSPPSQPSHPSRPSAPAPPPPTPLPRQAPTTLDGVEEALAATTGHDEVGRILLAYLALSFRRVALFQASRDGITAWMAQGEDIDQEAFARYSVDFKHPSLFLNLREGSGIHIGPVAPMESHRELALCWGGGLPRECVALPVRLKDRLVLVLYLDGGARGLGGVDIEQMHRLTALTAAAFERCILHKKRGYAQS